MFGTQEQGCYTECAYCTEVRPAIGAACPFCGGRVQFFQPAQMMDGPSSRRRLLEATLSLHNLAQAFHEAQAPADSSEAAALLRNALVDLLQQQKNYGFDWKLALIEYIQRLEEDIG